MPFKILNLFGVLDAKRTGEDALKASAIANGVDYVILRPGRLVGGPFTNLDVARLLQTEGGADNGVDVAVGDNLLGDCKRDAAAEAIVQVSNKNTTRRYLYIGRVMSCVSHGFKYFFPSPQTKLGFETGGSTKY